MTASRSQRICVGERYCPSAVEPMCVIMSLRPEVPRNNREGSSQCVRLVSTPTAIALLPEPVQVLGQDYQTVQRSPEGCQAAPFLLRTGCKKGSIERAHV